ncbi:unnamed protein product [Lathyrus oleraceus]|uniref:Protein DCL, chloroplastic n=1 Tax=Pisum sativum TaxID=3888 RepID=A0A9D4WK42_PEA|nr:protein DCL, chloroplastic isoform X1 [Pisum sativum]KAI5404324.1 hypothetical protein KIW84_051469 [Pisum sativum]
MASSLSNLKTPLHFHSFKTPFSFRSSSRFIPSFSYPRLFRSSISSLKAASASSSSDSAADNLLQKPVLSQGRGIVEEESCYDELEQEEEKWVDWEDQILEDTVPLVRFVRMILHSGIYENGDRINSEHEKTIVEKLLPFHPESHKKIGCGIDYITIGYHPDFDSSRCMFIVQKDGEMVDFSYWKCIKGLIRKNYPLYADNFILRHFRNRSRSFSK